MEPPVYAAVGRPSNGDPGATKEPTIYDEWRDVPFSPLQPNDVVAIDFTQDFRTLYGLFLAARALPERSERSMRLARAVIEHNKSDVSAWQFRCECAERLAESQGSALWQRELPSAASLIMKSPKNYQAWEYRRFVSRRQSQPDAELEFVNVMLDMDAKNYHAWSHRQWLVREGLVGSDELAATAWYIESDLRNNSAWNHRWLVVKGLEKDAREQQLVWALDMVSRAPRNGSAWNFVQALVASGADADRAKQAARLFLSHDAENVTALRFLVMNGDPDDKLDVVKRCDALMRLDPVRVKYWAFKRQKWLNLSTVNA